ncbi:MULTISPECIES: GlpM family protein [Solibacillus]|uniref:GlpM family protein n=1 Tax=Solibacillus palustris TaxID=2908203 RepID=A0ABS9UF50_9BACL|nr:GlpM family protein [Solibacillus daqui]MCH7322568.1 GlpM family protein [Solibacillus sp. MA9]
MFYIIQFIIGGTVMLLASWLSRSNLHFLSGVITLLPILTLLNMRLQMKSMTAETFQLVQQNAIFGAIGMVLFTSLVFYFSSIWKPGQAVLSALGIYIVFMVIGKPIMAMLQS